MFYFLFLLLFLMHIWLVLHSPHIASTKKTLYVVLKWVWCHHRISILFCGILKECWRKGKKRSKKICEEPTKSQCGFHITSTLLWRFTLNKLQVLPGLSLNLGGHTHICCHYLRFGWLCLEEQNCLCAYFQTDFVWLFAPSNRQHAACSNTNGKLI